MAINSRPVRSTEDALRMIRLWRNETVDEISAIDDGQTSLTFRFHLLGEWYILRISNNKTAYWYDKYAFDTLARRTGLPIPRVDHIGQEGSVAFAISQRLPGMTLSHRSEAEVQSLVPTVVEQLQRLQRTHPLDRRKFGTFGPNRDPIHESWQSALKHFFAEPESGYWKDFSRLFDHERFPAEEFWRMHDRMLDLAAYSPSESYVIHGDFHCGNILTNGDSVTGLIDWAQMLFGDWVFDVATFHLWSPQFNFAQFVKQQSEKSEFHLRNFQERLWCSTYAVGLDAARYDAKIGDWNACEYVMQRLREMESASWARV